MTLNEAVQYVETYKSHGDSVQLTNEFLRQISPEIAEALVKQFASDTLMYLPESEVQFFTWLKTSAPAVWQDIWGDDETEAVEYTVGMGLLPDLMIEQRGYPICDIVVEPPYYFTFAHVNSEEAKPLYEAILARVEQKKEMSLRDIFLLELRNAPIDIWRLAYLYGETPEVFKRVADELVQDEILRMILPDDLPQGSEDDMGEFGEEYDDRDYEEHDDEEEEYNESNDNQSNKSSTHDARRN
jgi:hypothetical protein